MVLTVKGIAVVVVVDELLTGTVLARRKRLLRTCVLRRGSVNWVVRLLWSTKYI